MEYLPNKLILFNSKIYYKEENYLKVKTTLLKYITFPIVKVQYISILCYLSISRSYILNVLYILNFIMWLSYPSSYGSTRSSSPTFSSSCTLSLSCTNSLLSTCTNWFIRSVTNGLNIFILVDNPAKVFFVIALATI